MALKYPSCQSPLSFEFDPFKSIADHFASLFHQAEELQAKGRVTNYVGALLLHLVGAKLDLAVGLGAIRHRGASVVDGRSTRSGFFRIDSVVIHVTASSSEALIRKIECELDAGLRPMIISIKDGVKGAKYLLKPSSGRDRVDVLDVQQFLVANVYERSLFQATECKVTLRKIFERYNEIVASCETDPLLRVQIAEASGPKKP